MSCGGERDVEDPVGILRGGAHYDRRRAASDHHNADLRNLANKLLSRLWWCLQNSQPWDDKAAWALATANPRNCRRLTTDWRGTVYVGTWSGMVYVAFVFDVFSRIITSWRVASSRSTDLVLDAQEMAIRQRQRQGHSLQGLGHHTDAGSQYTSFAFHSADRGRRGCLGRVGLGRVRQRHGRSIIGLLNTEAIRRRGPWRNLDDIEIATLEWVDWFNNRRLFEQGSVDSLKWSGRCCLRPKSFQTLPIVGLLSTLRWAIFAGSSGSRSSALSPDYDQLTRWGGPVAAYPRPTPISRSFPRDTLACWPIRRL